MRLLHTSDWHLGRQLHGVSLLEDQAHVLQQIVDIVRDEDVDAIAISGDIFDRAVPPAEAVTLLGKTLHELCVELQRPVIIIAGNHDSGERLGFASELLGSSGLHIAGPLSADPLQLTLTKAGQEYDFFALPYAGPNRVRHVMAQSEMATEEALHTHEDAMAALLDQVHRRRRDGVPSVLLAHCFVDGGQESDSERPLSLGGADRVPASLFQDFTYVALGHLHGAQYQGYQQVRYSGSILKYSFSEVHQRKSVTLVDINDDTQLNISTRPLKPLRELRVLEGRLKALLEAAENDPAREDFIAVRLTDKEALLDVMTKLRRVYPNVLQAQLVYREHREGPREAGKELLRKGHRELFADFFADIHGEPLDAAQSLYLDELLSSMQSEGLL